ncbi:unnamed protein product [Rotaria sp. Silwood1]|nr:unnamed protein product [Rotaria sp. Silwood1]
MSNIYIQESATRGKVVLDTTVGDIEIELFSKECPLACRNFVQLCMDGYYDGTVFHRVTLDLLERFRVKVHTAKDEQISESLNETQSEQIADKVQTSFLKHTFVSQELLDNVQDIYTNTELLTINDPRNPMTKRRRDESSMLLHQKKNIKDVHKTMLLCCSSVHYVISFVDDIK